MKKKKQNITNQEQPKYDIITAKDLVNFVKKNKKTLLIFLTLILIAYFNIIGGEFVTADDPETIKYLNSHTLKDSLGTFNIDSIYISLVHSLFGMSSSVFHVFSILIHMVNTLLAFCLAYLILKDKKLAILATIIFCVQPAA